MKTFICLILISLQLTAVNAFAPSRIAIDATLQKREFDSSPLYETKRRDFLEKAISSSAGAIIFSITDKAYAKSDANEIISQLKQARSQLDPVPDLIKEEKWDSVRAILITPPLADLWAKTSKPILKQYAEVQDDLPNGDELAVLELREEALDHFRFLDMAVYNNVFNPIKTEGETGATKELIRSYYEDPVNEYKACTRVLDELIKLGAN